uniref:Uncharacterized protein n=1 Tax=Terrapene triunguis TaxID=2587831 RepID=A0A674K086_9SAUR
LKGTSFFLGGILIVLLRQPLLGMLLEIYVLAFADSFARVTVFGFLGALGNIPLLSKVSKALGLDFMQIQGALVLQGTGGRSQ